MFAPVISLYDASGSQLLDIASRSEPGPVTQQFYDVSAGTEYIVRVGAFDKGAHDTEAFGLVISTMYQPLPLPLNASVTALNSLTIGPATGATIYRINPAADADVLAIELTSTNPNTLTALAPTLKLVGPTGTITTSSAGIGQSLFVAADIQDQGRPLDLYVAGTRGTDTATMQIGVLTLENTLTFDPSHSGQTSLETGELTRSSAVTDFGSLARVEYFQHITDPTELTQISATGSGGARPVVGYFNRDDGQFKLAGVARPDPNAMQVVTTAPLRGNDRHAVVAWNVGFDLSPTAQIEFQIDGPDPVPVEVGMVPDLQPDPPIPAGEFQSILKIDTVTIEAEYQRHFFKTILPNNIVDLPLVTLEPAEPAGDFQAVISVFRDDGQGNLLEQPNLEQLANSPPGNSLSFFIDAGCSDQVCRDQLIDNLRGRPLWFLIDPIEGQLGDGVYSLKVKVPTDEPFPFEVLEQAWRFPNSTSTITLNNGSTVAPDGTTNNNPALPKWGGDCNPLNNSQPAPSELLPDNDPYAESYGTTGGTVMPCVGTFPKSPVTGSPLQIADIVQNQYGDGVATGFFNTTTPYTDPFFGLGAIDVFRFWVTNPGPVSVRTVPLPNENNPNAAPVNTSLKLYQARFDANGELDYLIEMPEVSGSRDWFVR